MLRLPRTDFPFGVSSIIFSRRPAIGRECEKRDEGFRRNFHENASAIVMISFDRPVKPLPRGGKTYKLSTRRLISPEREELWRTI